MTFDRITRRRLLRGIGGATLALPFLPSVMPARAAGTTAAKRFVFVFTANGQYPENWWPDSTSTRWTNLAPHVREAPFETDATGRITAVLGPEFASLKDKLLLLRGLDAMSVQGGGHNAAWPLSGYQLDEHLTIDQVMAASDIVYPEPPPLRSLHMQVKLKSTATTTVSVADTGTPQQVAPHATAAGAFQQAFGDFEIEPPDPTEVKRRQLELGVIDRVREQYDMIHNHPRLGGEDRKRLEAHAELLHDLHQRLAVTSLSACLEPTAPAYLDAIDENLEQMTRDFIDLTVAAIRCDRSRVVTLMIGGAGDISSYKALGNPTESDHHGLSHEGRYSQPAVDAIALINGWFANQVASLLTALDDDVEDPETGTTFLDNSVVYWGNEDGCNGFDPHYQMSMPVLLAGSCAGHFPKLGRYVDYRQHGNASKYSGVDDRGRPYNALLVTLLEAMGIEAADGFGEYAGGYLDQSEIGVGKQPLPFL